MAGITLACPDLALAYLGPGAGFALVSSFFVFVVTLISAAASLLLFPLRLLLRQLRPRRPSLARRVVVIGFDGQDPRITEQLMAQGLLPAFSALAAQGAYRQLQTTTPPISPVAWSSFATGVQPGKHGIFDFVARDPRTYGAELAGVALAPPHRTLTLGRLRIPLGRPVLRLTRGSRPFWSILGEHRIWSTVLRVPVSFPPDRFRGAQLAATGVPDLKGTQGTFTLFTSRLDGNEMMENGDRVGLDRAGETWRAQLDGPPGSLIDGRQLSLAVTARPDGPDRLRLTIGAAEIGLRIGELSPWMRLTFRDVWPVKVWALVRLQLLELGEHVSVYMSPLHLDPARPAMPLSHPGYFSAYLEKRIGPFATLGLAEDTSSFNAGVVDLTTFTQQVNEIDRERGEMLMASLDRTSEGVVVCVFDATDRVQHMCWAGGTHATPSSPIVQQYQRNDRLLASVVSRLSADDLLLVLSDHGFTAFERSVGLNAWLERHGFLVRRPGGDDTRDWLGGVDWKQTRAYALGLAGIFLNIAGRERHGIVAPAEVPALIERLRTGLLALHDHERDATPIRRVLASSVVTPGPYVDRAPDLFVGYAHGYRVSWDSARGRIDADVLSDNAARWSGDHCVDPQIVPGVLFSNRAVASDDPSLLDIAPTILTAFGVEVPKHMDGQSLLVSPAGSVSVHMSGRH